MIGQTLGPYEVLAKIGAGGMGEVYKARDTRLDRIVAVKVLPAAFAGDAQFRERFNREARAVSQLEHRHICALYDVGEQDGTAYLVMQYLEGETLAERLTRGPLPLEAALETALQVADALGAAHKAGIVHRDLKPGNIFLQKSGAGSTGSPRAGSARSPQAGSASSPRAGSASSPQVKLLDFGLAKSMVANAAPADFTMLPTTPPNLTQQGTILGTFQYMAPEQLEGGDADARADIFAFGVVLFEMVTGRKPFEGKSQANLIASIMSTQPPPVSSLQPLAPPALDRAISTCLAKDPDDRFQTAHDLKLQIQWVAEGGGRAAAPAASSRRTGLVEWIALASVGIVTGAVVIAAIAWMRAPREQSATPVVTRSVLAENPFDQRPPNPDPFDRTIRPRLTDVALSPDGRRLVFVVRDDPESAPANSLGQLYERRLDRLEEATPIAGTEQGEGPFFSPDGEWLAFWAGGELRKVAPSGGPASMICKVPGVLAAPGGGVAAQPVYGAHWGGDTIVFATEDGLWRVSAGGGVPAPIGRDASDRRLRLRLPRLLPGGDAVLFTIREEDSGWDSAKVAVLSLKDGKRKVLVDGGADGRYVASGHLVYMRLGTIMAKPFDLERLEVRGEAISLVDHVMQAANMPNSIADTGAAQVAISDNGTLAYVTGGIRPDIERQLVWVDQSGRIEAIPAPRNAYLSPRLSPDGRGIAAWTQGMNPRVWVYDLKGATLTPVSTVEDRARWAVWTNDSTRVVSAQGNSKMYWAKADGTGKPEPLTTTGGRQLPAAMTRDGKHLVFVELNPKSGYDIWLMDMASRQVRPLVQTAAAETYPDVSPDGRWLAYTSNQSGHDEVYVQPLFGTGPRVTVSASAGQMPAWTRDGTELAYIERPPETANFLIMNIVQVSTTDGAFSVLSRRSLFKGAYGVSFFVRSYDIGPDRRFLLARHATPKEPKNELVLVTNWFAELKARVKQ